MNNEFCLRLSNLSKRTQKQRVVLFFGRETFSDNTKYLYLKALQEKTDFQSIWCSCEENVISSLKEKDLPCHYISSDTIQQTISLFLSAAVVVFSVNPSQSLQGNEELFSCLQGARHIQLWHGVSVKHLLLELTPHLNVLDYHFRRALNFASRADCVLSTSSQLDRHFKSFFGCERIVRAGYPRNEVIIRAASEYELIGSELPPSIGNILKNNKSKKILFAPTWQRGESDLMTSDPKFCMQLARLCHKNKAELFIKTHPTLINSEKTRKLPGNVSYINPSLDIYPYLKDFDLLITDYSSIMFDFILTKKPVLRLEIAKGQHTNFEPDFSLVPDIDFAYTFNRDNIEHVLNEALNNDSKHSERQNMAAALYETEVLQSCASLIRLLERDVTERVNAGRALRVEQY